MAYRKIFSNFILRHPRFAKPLLFKPNVAIMRVQSKADIRPITKFLEKPINMFSPAKIIKYYEVIPLLIVVLGGICCEFIHVVRLAFTRDDVRYVPLRYGGEMISEKLDWDKDKPPKARKALVFNQKYEKYPDGLLEALDALKPPTEEEQAEIDEARAKKEKSKKK